MIFCGVTNNSAETNVKGKEKYRADGDSDKQHTEHTPCKCFRYRYVYNIISKFPKTPK